MTRPTRPDPPLPTSGPGGSGTAWWTWLLDWLLRAAVVGLIFYAFNRLDRGIDATLLDRLITTLLVATGGAGFVIGFADRHLQAHSLRTLNWIAFLPAVALVCFAYRMLGGTPVEEPGVRGVAALLVGWIGLRSLIGMGMTLRQRLDRRS